MYRLIFCIYNLHFDVGCTILDVVNALVSYNTKVFHERRQLLNVLLLLLRNEVVIYIYIHIQGYMYYDFAYHYYTIKTKRIETICKSYRNDHKTLKLIYLPIFIFISNLKIHNDLTSYHHTQNIFYPWFWQKKYKI